MADTNSNARETCETNTTNDDGDGGSVEKVCFTGMRKRPELSELFRRGARLTKLVFDTVYFESDNHRAPYLLRDIVAGSTAVVVPTTVGFWQDDATRVEMGTWVHPLLRKFARESVAMVAQDDFDCVVRDVLGTIGFNVVLPPSVTSLTCDAIRPTTQELAMLACCGNIVELSLARNTIGRRGLRSVLSMRNLTSLDLSRSNIHDFVGVWPDAQCATLTTLKLAGNKITAHGLLAILDALPSLVTLDASHNEIDFEHLELPSSSRHTGFANFGPNSDKHTIPTFLTEPSKLQALNISHQPVGDRGIVALAFKTPCLVELRAQFCQLTSASTQLLKSFAKMSYADLYPLR